ncbi:DUF72 domain-containing protein [Dyella subtropica]|uniref:DUF72 domain-containing protein n=1 Tax=Dyella subtropica TaxID=2992127 RepID=UPI00225BAAE6|nr:DUF72 domain-containing protein [Dyella subtropica]
MDDLFAAPPAGHDGTPHIRVGIGGWNYAPWRKNFYPDGLPQRRELEYASQHLRAIEINGTYYGAQKAETYARWAAETPASFVFSLKAPRYVTEGKRLATTGKGVSGFVHGGLAEMGDRLGPILWQLPPSRPFDADDLAAFLDLLPRELNGRPLRHVLEVRHPSFLSESYVALVRPHGIPTVFTDSPDYPSLADLTGNFSYARLMRSEDGVATGYAAEALDQWADRARQWSAGGDVVELPHVAAPLATGAPRDVFVFFISAAKHRNPAAAMALQQRVNAKD